MTIFGLIIQSQHMQLGSIGTTLDKIICQISLLTIQH